MQHWMLVARPTTHGKMTTLLVWEGQIQPLWLHRKAGMSNGTVIHVSRTAKEQVLVVVFVSNGMYCMIPKRNVAMSICGGLGMIAVHE